MSALPLRLSCPATLPSPLQAPQAAARAWPLVLLAPGQDGGILLLQGVVSSPAATSHPAPRQTEDLSIREQVRLTWILNPATVP